jgi:hypothetical protein
MKLCPALYAPRIGLGAHTRLLARGGSCGEGCASRVKSRSSGLRAAVQGVLIVLKVGVCYGTGGEMGLKTSQGLLAHLTVE